VVCVDCGHGQTGVLSSLELTSPLSQPLAAPTQRPEPPLRDQARKRGVYAFKNDPRGHCCRRNLPLPAQGHDIYSHLKNGAGESCCDNRDCRPVLYRLSAGGVQMLVDGRWIAVPREKIQYRAQPGDTGETGGGHWCGSAYEPTPGRVEDLYVTKCAILPPQAASAQ
jgi:hypothetical protein